MTMFLNENGSMIEVMLSTTPCTSTTCPISSATDHVTNNRIIAIAIAIEKEHLLLL